MVVPKVDVCPNTCIIGIGTTSITMQTALKSWSQAKTSDFSFGMISNWIFLKFYHAFLTLSKSD